MKSPCETPNFSKCWIFQLILVVHEIFVASSRSALVCPGDQLTLTCTTNSTLTIWSVEHPSGVGDQVIRSTGNDTIGPFVTNLGVFIISRSSTSPLISVFEIDNITTLINGTRINCSYLGGKDTTIINIIENDKSIPNFLVTVSKRYDTETVTVLLEWAQEGALYNVTVVAIPPVQVTFTDNNAALLTVSYNTFYNVSVATRCGLTSTYDTQLHYIKCGYPFVNELSSAVLVSGYSDPALVGTNVTLSCPVEDELAEFKNTTLFFIISCTDNGQWDPDPRQLRCTDTSEIIYDCGVPVANSSIIIMYNSTLEGSLINFRCSNGLVPNNLLTSVCTKSTNWYPNPSNHSCASLSAGSGTSLSETAIITIAFLVIGLAVFFAVGFFSGGFFLKYKQSLLNACRSESVTSQVNSSKRQEVQDLEMMENVAYGPLPATNTNN